MRLAALGLALALVACGGEGGAGGGGGLAGPENTLKINIAGTGTGRVGDGYFDCPSVRCFSDVSPGRPVELTAVADPGSTFVGWSGCGCSGTGTCRFTMNGHMEVTATFNR